MEVRRHSFWQYVHPFVAPEVWRYQKSFTWGIQELIEALILLHFAENRLIVSHAEVKLELDSMAVPVHAMRLKRADSRRWRAI